VTLSAVTLADGFHPRHRLPASRKVILGAEILAAYVAARRSSRTDDLRETLRSVRSTAVTAAYDLEPHEELYVAYRLGRIVERILRFLPDARCLTRSIVLVQLLARRGVSSVLVIGVSPAPEFKAHAWVELAGVPLLPAYEATYSRLVEL
jgi:hypothetical protein